MVPTLDVRRLNAEKKYEGKISFSFEADRDSVSVPLAALEGPVLAELSYAILEGDWVEIKGTLTFTLKGACSRCLKETVRTFCEEVEGYFVPDGDGLDDYAYRGGVVDLNEFLREAVLYSMPAGLYCSEACTAPEYRKD